MASSADLVARIKSFLADELQDARRALEGGSGRVSGEAVHEARKSIKKLRAVLRLVQKMADPKKVHSVATHLREAAHRLGPMRDAEVLRATVQSLRKRGEAWAAGLGGRRHPAGAATRSRPLTEGGWFAAETDRLNMECGRPEIRIAAPLQEDSQGHEESAQKPVR